MKRAHPLLIAASVLTFATALSPSPALATSYPLPVDFAIGVGGHVGGATLSNSGLVGDEQSSTDPGGGAQVWLGVQLMKTFTFGLAFDYTASSHAFGDAGFDVDVSAFSGSILMRLTPGDHVAFKAWFGFGSGRLSTTGQGIDASVIAGGTRFGCAAHYRVPISADDIWIEVGPYFTHSAFNIEKEDRGDSVFGSENTTTRDYGYGLVMDLVFEIGL